MAVATIEEYIAGYPAEVRDILRRIRATIHKAEPGVTETITYGMPTMVLEGRHAIYFAAWKRHVAIYPVHAAPQPLESDLAPHREAKDTVRFVYAEPVPWELVERLIGFLVTTEAHPA